ncbi:MAG: hypothetical protein ACM3QZ_10095 [Solirubrobacterales bacterium]
MANLRMMGPYFLTAAEIDKQVTGDGCGNYALVVKDYEGFIRVRYVGRADDNLKEALKYWLGRTRNPLFKFSYAESPLAAFEKECHSYHDFEPNDNHHHPMPPARSSWTCPRCVRLGF